MAKAIAKLRTMDLRVGMYVTKLDRPWLGTPFLMQGFEISNQEEIQDLQKYCSFVLVDPSLSSVPVRADPEAERKADPEEAFAVPGAKDGDLSKIFGRPLQNYKNTIELRDELPQSELALKAAGDSLRDVLKDVRSGKKVNVQELEAVAGPMVDSVLRNSDAMSWLLSLRHKDSYAFRHSLGCSVVAVVFGRQVGLGRDLLQSLALGALLFDIGKVRMPGSILIKPALLDGPESKLMERHIDYGLEILESATTAVDPIVSSMLLHHHERHDGSGYPDGLAGEEIPVFARMAGIIDTYDAMTSSRPYAQPKSTAAAIQHLIQHAGVHFQAELVEQFIQAIGVFPTGALVEMNTGEVGVVVEQNRERRLRPVVMMLLDDKKAHLSMPEMIDLRTLSESRDDPAAVWIMRGLEPGAYGIDPSEFYLD